MPPIAFQESAMQVGEGGQDSELDALFRAALKEVWG
ncbi:hypothetical protein J2736_003493 [Paenibacillus qinlingensis]|uniref:Uncharacterized protein n=1 Tax=Paenibacillus qinlingensis TaxID=1837343 RepID=A0ABU1NYY5_9BACL|nr:hypothetical protein [Paenibacillus qinlingensis]